MTFNNNYIKQFTLLITIVLIAACSKKDNGDGGNPQNPDASILVFPIENSECNEGTILSETESNVTFEWNAANHAEKYTLVVKNLLTDVSEDFPSNNTFKEVTILRGVPYSWHVISKSNATPNTGTSATWKFYNAGDGVENYAPFPANLVSPPMSGLTNTTVALNWSGNDIDSDISNYDILVGTSNPPTAVEESTSNTSINLSSLIANTTYYWRVITHDAHGNSSQSPVFEFVTQ